MSSVLPAPYQSRCLAAGLVGLGLRPGDRLGIWSPNSYEWIVTQFAAAIAGLVLVRYVPITGLLLFRYVPITDLVFVRYVWCQSDMD